MSLLQNLKNDTHKRKSMSIITFFFISFLILDFVVSIFLRNGLEKYYGLDSEAKIALIGHSHLMLGIDKVKMENELGINIAKYTSEGVNVSNRQLMIGHLLNKNNKIETIIYGVDAWTFTGQGLSENSHVLFYPFLNDSNINYFVKNSVSGIDYWSRKIIKSSRYNEGLIASSMRGYFSNWENLKFGKVDIERLTKSISLGEYRKIENNKENIDILIETIEELQKKEINIILLYIPTIDIINQVEHQKFQENLAIFRSIDKNNNNVEFVNFLEPFSHQYELFFDPIHLNQKGQSKVTNELIKLFNTNNLKYD